MSFNRSTTVVQSGLGDEQYQVIQGNQTGIGTQLEEGFGGCLLYTSPSPRD